MGGVVDTIENIGSSAVNSAENVVSDVEKGLSKGWHSTDNALTDVAHTLGSGIEKIGKGAEKIGSAAWRTLPDTARTLDKATRQTLKGQLGPATGTIVRGAVQSGDKSIANATSKSDANTIIPVATAIVGAVNPLVGAALTGARSYAYGSSPLQVAKNAAISYGASQLGQYVGGQVGAPANAATGAAAVPASGLAGYTGSQALGNAAGGFTSGTTSGLLQGEGVNQSLRQGAASGLTAGAVTALNGSPTGTLSDMLTRGAEQYVIGDATRSALGVGSSTPGTSGGVSLPAGLGAPQTSAVASATPAGPATITGSAVDITGSDPTQQRRNVWNQGSLKIKDALGA